jgi:hypothetical protein
VFVGIRKFYFIERVGCGDVKEYMQEKEQTPLGKFDASFIGCVIDGSAQSADYINSETIEFASQYGFEFEPIEVNGEDYSQILSEEGDNAVSFLNVECDCLAYCNWYFEDNSLFYGPDIDSVKEDADFISSTENEYPDDDYEGQWLHINDHGNVTLYVRVNGQDKEIWSIV